MDASVAELEMMTNEPDGEAMKRVVVTGAAGFIGSHLSERLVHLCDEVIGVDCFTDYYERDAKESNLEALRQVPNFRFVEADLRSDDLAPLFDGVDVVINLAASPGLVRSWEEFDQYESNNLRAVQRIADAMLATGVGHLVQASTSSVYGADATGPETSETLPISPYGVTKLAGEHLLRAYGMSRGLPLTILRYFSVYGPRQRPDMAYRIFCERLIDGEEIVVFGDGLQSRSNTYVSDIVEGTIAAARQAPTGEIYNIGGGREITLLEAVELLGDALGVEPRIRFEEGRAGDQRRTVAQSDKARGQLGWEPSVLPAEGLALQAEWVRSLRDR